MEADNDLPFMYAAESDYTPLSRNRKLAEEVAHLREQQQEVAKQNTYRVEMEFVQAVNDMRRARWWSLSAYIICAMCALATVLFTLQPGLISRWRSVMVALVTFAACLYIVGRKRDGQHAKNSWTRLRFSGPKT